MSILSTIVDWIIPYVLPIVQSNMIPDKILRLGIRYHIDSDVQKTRQLSSSQMLEKEVAFVNELKNMPIAVAQKEANDQHYEVPDEFYRLVLGPRLKYSSGYFPDTTTTLAESEIAMLELYCERAEICDGMNLVDLGCGWGSLTLFLAAKYPKCSISSISNSKSQKEYIMSEAARQNLNNITVYTGDISVFDLPSELHRTFDRVLSVEMFEHMKNYEKLLQKVSTWLLPGGNGKLFVHIFVNKDVPFHYEEGWMTETFFTGGQLPSDRLLLFFQKDLYCEKQWRVNGKHYQRTQDGWLALIDERKAEVLSCLGKTYGDENAFKHYVNWRLFFIVCSEFFGIYDGEEYYVSHYLFRSR
jgi:cyclopropane-fatty-acyl-phospholipid synthase